MADQTNPFDTFDEPSANAFDQFDAPAQKPAGVGRKAADIGLSVAKGIVAVPEAAVGVADIVTGGAAGRGAERLGVRFKDAKQVLTDLQSDDLKAKQRQFQEADGILEKTGVALSNPSLIANTVAESLPAVGAGGVVGRGIMAAAPRVAPLVAGAAGEGVVGAGMAAENIRQESPTGELTPGQAALAAGSGAATAGLGVAGGRAARALGIGDVDTMAVTGTRDVVQGAVRAGAKPKGVVRRVAEGAAAEGLLEEVPQSLAEQALQNVALDRPVTEGLEDAAVMGGLAGGVMGGVAGGISRPAAPPPAPGPLTQAAMLATAGTSPGAAPPAPRTYQQDGPIAPNLTTSPGARAPAQPGVDFEATIDTSGLSVEDTAAKERDRAQRVDFQRPDTTPNWETSAGAAPRREGLEPPARDIDTSGLDIQREGGPLTQAARLAPAPAAGAAGAVAAPAPLAEVAAPPALPGPKALPNLPREGDILAEDGGPFRNGVAAARAAKAAGAGYRPVRVEGGFAVRRDDSDVIDVQAREISDSLKVSHETRPRTVDDGAHQAAASPKNDLPEPTKAQILAGNAKLGHAKVGGLGLSVESPAGSVREDKQNTPPKWRTPMEFGYHYGYFKRTEAADSSEAKRQGVDAFVKAGLPEDYSGPVFVVDQVDPKTGKFDEHKVVIGPANEREAMNTYRKHYEPGWKGGVHVTRMSMADFRKWVRSGKKELPAVIDPSAPTADAGAAPASPPPAGPARVSGQDGQPAGGAGAAPAAAVAKQRDFGDFRPMTIAEALDLSRKLERDSRAARKEAVNGPTPMARSFAKDRISSSASAARWLRERLAFYRDSYPDARKEYEEAVARSPEPETNPAKPETKPAKPETKGLRVGTTPGDAEPVTVRDGVVYIGRFAAANFETGEDVRVPQGANPMQIKKALQDAGAIARRYKFFGGEVAQAPTPQENVPAQNSTAAAPSQGAGTAASSDAAAAAPTTPSKKQEAPPTGGREQPQQQQANAGGRNARSAAWDRNPFRVFLATHGVSSKLVGEFAPGPKERRSALVPGVGPIFKKTGLQLDELAQRAVEEGFLPRPDADRLHGMIAAALRGDRIAPLYAEGGAEQEAQRRMQAQRDAEEAIADLPDAAIAELAQNDDSIPWGDVESTATMDSAMRALGFTEEEIDHATATAQSAGLAQEDGQGSRGPVEAAQGAAAGPAAQGAAGPRDDAQGLSAPSEADVLEQQRRREDGERAEGERRASEEARARADAERDEFTLTGSNRPADVAAAGGQQDIFSAPREPTTIQDIGEKDKPAFSRASKPKADERDLIVQHNITAENVLHVERLGGLAVPSIAITKVDAPLENFGEISLLGDVGMATPKGDTKVFGADIYSPRYPKVSHKLSDAQWKQLAERLKPFRVEGDGMSRWNLDANDLAESLISHKPFQRMVAAKRGVEDPNAIGYHQLRTEAAEFLTDIGAQERIFQGFTYSGNRRYAPHTMDTVVKILKKELRGGENFNYGVGSVRAKHTPQFRTISSIKAAKGQLVPKEQFEAIKEEVNKELFALADRLASFHPASKSFGFTDSVTMMLGDAARMGIPRALEENGFQDTSPEAMQDIRDYLVKLRGLPTEYFEGKITRPVALSEFRAAVVPSDTQPRVREILERAGLRLYTYEKGKEGDRARVVKQAAQETPDAMFSRVGFRRGGEEAPFAEQRTAMIRQAVESYAKDWKVKPQIHVIATMADAPAEVRSELGMQESQGATGETDGFYFDGGVYLIAANIQDANHARRVLFHEALGHFGLRAVFGDRLVPILRQLATMRPQLVARKAKEYGLDLSKDADRIMAAEEVLAELAQERPQIGWVQRAIAAIRQWLRAHGVNMGLSDNDVIANYILPARGFVERGRGARAEATGEPALSRNHAREIQVEGKWRPIDNSKGQPVGRDFQEQTNFWKWFGESRVVDEKGKPLVVFHGTKADIPAFSPSRGGEYGSGIYLTPDEGAAWLHAERASGDGSQNVMPVYVSLRNPYMATSRDEVRALGVKKLKEQGYDGIIATGTTGEKQYVAFDPEQVKSAIGNRGTFDPKDPRVAFSRSTLHTDASSFGTLTPDQEQALKNVGGIRPAQTVRERFDELRSNLGLKITQGLFDQFAPIKALGQKEYMLARMSKASEGTMEAALLYGKPFLRDGVADVDVKDGGFAKVLASLQGEHDRFLWWVAAQRAERLKAEGRENLFTDADISNLKTLDAGAMADGTGRGQVYAAALKELNAFNEAALKLAMDSGLINAAAYEAMRYDPYVPFYRLMEDGAELPTFRAGNGLVNQQAFKKLKGGTDRLNNDLLQNLLLNWNHLFAAAAKNRAAVAAMEAAEKLAIAYPVDSGAKGAVKVMVGGAPVHYQVEDPYLLEAITALHYVPSPLLKPLNAAKNLLTLGVTANPAFKIRNIMRDSIAAIAQADLGYNPFKNVADGWKATHRDSQTYASMLAAGGLMRFGTNEDSSRVRRQIESFGGAQMLDETGWQKLTGQLKTVWDAYQELGDRGENVNRAALYEKLIAQGKSHAEASFMARDLMDFSMGGRWGAVRFLAQTVPFLNARLVGLHRLAQGAKNDPRRFATVSAAVMLASLALLAAYGDDDDWKRREDWDRDTYWWFKIGDTAFRIPKPFEIGAMGTLAERTAELMLSDEMTGKRFGKRLSAMLFQTFSFDPTPQAFKPLLDVYANKDSFTGRPIEGFADQRLRPQDRVGPRTSEVARLLGQLGLPDPAQLAKGEYAPLSPKQVDFLLRGYFGWFGTVAQSVSDYGVRPLMDRGERPAMQLRDVFLAGNFVEALPSGSSRYVSTMYEQAREIEQAYASYHAALKAGEVEKAAGILESDGDKIRSFRQVVQIKRAEGEINAQIRRIEEDRTMGAQEKRDRIAELERRKEAAARPLKP